MKEGPPGRAHGDALASRKSRAPRTEWSCEKEAPGHAPGSLFKTCRNAAIGRQQNPRPASRCSSAGSVWPGATCPTEIIMQRRPTLTSALAIGVSHLASDQQRAGAAPATGGARVQAACCACGDRRGLRNTAAPAAVAGMHADGGALLPGQLVDAQVHLLATRGVQTRIHVFAVDIGVVRHHAAREGDAAHAQLGAIAAGPVIPVHDQGLRPDRLPGARAPA